MYTTFEKLILRAILKAQLNNNFTEVNKMVEGTEFEDEFLEHGPSLFQIRSRAHARKLLNRFLMTGEQPVITETVYHETDWEYGENEYGPYTECIDWEYVVEEASSFYNWYYLCARESVNSTMCCFAPHLSEEAEKMGIKVTVSENSFELIETGASKLHQLGLTKYEDMAISHGFDLDAA